MTLADKVLVTLLIGAAGWLFVMQVRVARARRRLQALRDHHESMWP